MKLQILFLPFLCCNRYQKRFFKNKLTGINHKLLTGFYISKRDVDARFISNYHLIENFHELLKLLLSM